MIPNFPKPMFLGQIHPGLVGTLTFCSSKKCSCSRLTQAQTIFWGPGTHFWGILQPMEAGGQLIGGLGAEPQEKS